MKKLICFDLDGTLTQHRTPLEQSNKLVLDELSKKYKLLMVGAGGAARINKQLNNYPVDILGNYGMNEGVFENGEFKIIRDDRYEVNKEFFREKIEYFRKKYGYENYVGASVEFHNSGMVTVPLLGTEADINDKIKFDPTREKRKVLYPEICEVFKDYTVYIGGSSSFDIAKKKYNKYDAIMTYAQKSGYNKDEILFVGDDFGDGGGDSHVRLNNLDYVCVTDYKRLKEFLSFLL